MKQRLQRFAPALLAVAIAAGGGVALTTLAQAQNAPAAPAAAPMPPHPPMEHGGPGMRGMHGGRMMKEVERLKTSLKLTSAQTALWDRAQEQMKPPTDMRDKMKAHRERTAAMLDDPNFDPRKLVADMDSASAERRVKMTAIRDAWFALYDSLNPVQRGQAREFLRSHMGRPHGMMMEGAMDGRRGPGGWGGPGGESGKGMPH